MAIAPNIPRPEASLIYLAIDRIQKAYEEEFAKAFQNVNRQKAYTFWNDGFEAGWKARGEHDAAAVKSSSN